MRRLPATATAAPTSGRFAQWLKNTLRPSPTYGASKNHDGPVERSEIDVELKEAVCDALLNELVKRMGGKDGRGRTIYGGSPSRRIFAGQLLPRFDVSGTLDETTGIRIAAIGMDFVVGTNGSAAIHLTPGFSAHLRSERAPGVQNASPRQSSPSGSTCTVTWSMS